MGRKSEAKLKIDEFGNLTRGCKNCNIFYKIAEFPPKGNLCHACAKKYHNAYYKKNKNNKVQKKFADAYGTICRKCSVCSQVKRLDEFPANGAQCVECKKEIRSQYYQNNREQILIKIKDYSKEHRSEISEREKQRVREDINFKLTKVLRGRIRDIIGKNIRLGSAVADLGCSLEFLRDYLESKFYPNPKTGEAMTWQNHSSDGWHIDHIIPLSSFNLSDREQFLKACHYSNLQPLWAEENLKKGAKVGVEYNNNNSSTDQEGHRAQMEKKDGNKDDWED